MQAASKSMLPSFVRGFRYEAYFGGKLLEGLSEFIVYPGRAGVMEERRTFRFRLRRSCCRKNVVKRGYTGAICLFHYRRKLNKTVAAGGNDFCCAGLLHRISQSLVRFYGGALSDKFGKRHPAAIQLNADFGIAFAQMREYVRDQLG